MWPSLEMTIGYMRRANHAYFISPFYLSVAARHPPRNMAAIAVIKMSLGSSIHFPIGEMQSLADVVRKRNQPQLEKHETHAPTHLHIYGTQNDNASLRQFDSRMIGRLRNRHLCVSLPGQHNVSCLRTTDAN